MLAAAQGTPAFTCADCEIVERCGLAPSEDCIERAAQIARDPDGEERRWKRRLQYSIYR